jgi:hypothetical protein
VKGTEESRYRQNLLGNFDCRGLVYPVNFLFDLKLLYPKRKRFHISEVVNFMGLVGIYFLEIGERDIAEKYYDVLQQIGRGYPITKQLRNRLFPGLFRRLYLRLTGRS